ncbi:GNAT family N-acetyltransferase [Altererythrobacter aquiaggeris]|uniref:GNAT family N-acetyltransferase n=1 Tax=Aestuarierythrobacter aquiaggeris TaxID=1898396 RepID=UPI003017251E
MPQADLKLPDGCHPAAIRDSRQIGSITADAFRHDPFNTWLFGRFGAMNAAFRTLARHVYVPRGVSYRLADEAAAMWMMPGGDIDLPGRILPLLALNLKLRGSAGVMGRIEATTQAMKTNHPAKPHAYLFTIGVRAGSRGKGLGRVLMRPMLDHLDRASIPAYLENSNPDNTRFYRSFGFEHRKLIYAADGAPPLEAMWREPQGFERPSG